MREWNVKTVVVYTDEKLEEELNKIEQHYGGYVKQINKVADWTYQIFYTYEN